MLIELNASGKDAGVSINHGKSKIITKTTNSSKNFLKNKELETIPEMVYLGQQISMENRNEKEVVRRLTLVWKKYWALKHIFKGNFNNRQKSEIFNMCAISVLTYGSPTWVLTEKIIKKITTMQNFMMRSILVVKLKDRVSISFIKAKLPKLKKLCGNNL